MTSATTSGVNPQGNIISISRREDIPAFKGDWFLKQLTQGYTDITTYAGNQRVSLLPEDVTCFYFWSKNYKPFMPVLNKIKDIYNCVFCYTITGLPKVFEPNVPDTQDCIFNLKELSDLFSPEQILWRYDPILISNITDTKYHINKFTNMCKQLSGYTKKCIFSFPTFYGKVKDNINFFKQQTGISIYDISLHKKQQLSTRLAYKARRYNIKMFTCSNDYLINSNVFKSSCINGNLVNQLFNLNVPVNKDTSQRVMCGCTPSTDIGSYNQCRHGCVYCYANPSHITKQLIGNDEKK